MAAVIGRMKAVWIVAAVAVSVVVSGAPALARNVPCAANSNCIGTKKADTIKGPVANILDGKAGNDKLYSGGASDVIGGPGNDVVSAKNGAPDTIDCGPGKDKVSFDAALDSITNCESQGS